MTNAGTCWGLLSALFLCPGIRSSWECCHLGQLCLHLQDLFIYLFFLKLPIFQSNSRPFLPNNFFPCCPSDWLLCSFIHSLYHSCFLFVLDNVLVGTAFLSWFCPFPYDLNVGYLIYSLEVFHLFSSSLLGTRPHYYFFLCLPLSCPHLTQGHSHPLHVIRSTESCSAKDLVRARGKLPGIRWLRHNEVIKAVSLSLSLSVVSFFPAFQLKRN